MDNEEKMLIPNTTQIPNMLEDSVFPRIPEPEMRCLMYVCRRTFGFRKKEDRISLSQFAKGIVDRDGNRLDYGAGLSRPSVVKALNSLVAAGALFSRNDSKGNFYEINLSMNPDKVVNRVNQLTALTSLAKKRRKEAKTEGKWLTALTAPEVVNRVNRSGKPRLPKVVNRVNPQNKEKPSIQNQGRERGAGAPTPGQQARKFFSDRRERERAVSALVERGVPEQEAGNEISRFVSYWTERTRSGTRQRWETEKTFEVGRRLATWFSRAGRLRGGGRVKTGVVS